MTKAAGTSTGLKKMKSGVATASPTRLAMSETPERSSNMPPRGTPARRARSWEPVRDISGKRLITPPPSPPWCCVLAPPW